MKAIDLLKLLEKDPNYKKRLQEDNDNKKKIKAEINVIEAPLINLLNEQLPNQIGNFSDLLKLKELNKEAICLILKWTPQIENVHSSQEMLVRALGLSKEPFDGKSLAELFDNKKSSFTLKWAIGNTIANGMAQNIKTWLKDKLESTNQPKENEMLIYAAIKYFPALECRFMLKKLFRIFPLQVADSFTYIGGKEELQILKDNIHQFKGEAKKKINVAIKKMTVRLNQA